MSTSGMFSISTKCCNMYADLFQKCIFDENPMFNKIIKFSSKFSVQPWKYIYCCDEQQYRTSTMLSLSILSPRDSHVRVDVYIFIAHNMHICGVKPYFLMLLFPPRFNRTTTWLNIQSNLHIPVVPFTHWCCYCCCCCNKTQKR